MAELESVIEQKLIDQLVYGESQWIYRPDLKTEDDLWNNFRYILEQNNKDRLDGEGLSDRLLCHQRGGDRQPRPSRHGEPAGPGGHLHSGEICRAAEADRL